MNTAPPRPLIPIFTSTPNRTGFARLGKILACLLLCALCPVGCKSKAELKPRGTTPGELLTVKVGDEILTFSWIPRGRFLMGSPSGETSREEDEEQVEVKISDGFWLARMETTQATWQSVMGNNPADFDSNPTHPVETVSWEDCQKFLAAIQKYSPSAHWRFDLPTEAQWEYACRAGSPFPFTDNLENVAWHLNNARGRTHPVGTKSPNPWGLHDMHGNVAEWCSSLYARELPAFKEKDEPETSPTDDTALEANFRVIRGGSWDSAWACRAAARNSDSPSLKINRVGFRIALVPVK